MRCAIWLFFDLDLICVVVHSLSASPLWFLVQKFFSVVSVFSLIMSGSVKSEFKFG